MYLGILYFLKRSSKNGRTTPANFGRFQRNVITLHQTFLFIVYGSIGSYGLFLYVAIGETYNMPRKYLIFYHLDMVVFSCESRSRNANVCQSVNLSVSLSVTLIFLSDLLVNFIIANHTEMKLRQSLKNLRQDYDN